MSDTARRAVAAVLFDLDGTLIDSAPDLAGAANDMRRAHGLLDLPYADLRPMVGSGARGMVGKAFGVGPENEQYDALRTEFLSRYELRMLQLTAVFEAVTPVLAALNERRIPWGIVTNKATRYAEPVVRALGLEASAQVLICGDTTAHSKPHPEPLLAAARRLGLSADACVYVGDDLRDVQAGRAAGMQTLIATWGYLGEGDAAMSWGANATLDKPADLLKWLQLA